MRTRLPLFMVLVLSLTACRANDPTPVTVATPIAISTTASRAISAVLTATTAVPRTPPRPTVATLTPYPTLPLPIGCDETKIRGVVAAFIAAFNRGDQDGLTRVFPVRGSDGDHPWSGDPNQLRWFTLVRANPSKGIDALNLYTRETLLAYFAERHAQHEQIRVLELVVNQTAGGPGAPAINFLITRMADDLPESTFGGKGGVSCAHSVIYLWSQGGPFVNSATPTP